jgi:aminoglycoside phosphotransferase
MIERAQAPLAMSSASGPDRAERLRIARRADWRFLLTHPLPRRALVIGPSTEEMLAALRQSCGTVLHVESAEEMLLERFDLVVLSGASPDEAARATAHLVGGGSLYWETPADVPAAVACRVLAEAGLEDPRAYWHRPDFENCLEIIALEDGVLRHVLRGGAHGLRGEFRRAAGRWLHRLGRMESVARSRSVIARRPGVRSVDPGPATRLMLQTGDDEREGSLLVRTPRFRASAHVLLFAFPPEADEPRVLAKVPRLGTNHTLDREAACLEALEHFDVPGVPRLDVRERFGGVATLVESIVPGRPIHPDRLRRDPDRLVDQGVQWIIEFHGRTRRRGDQPAAWWTLFVEEPLAVLESAFGHHPDLRARIARTRDLVQPLHGAVLPTVYEHGDLGSPNLLLAPDGSFGVVDWELARPRGLVTADLFFFLGFAAVAREGVRSPDSFGAAFRSAFCGDEGWARSRIDRYGDALGVDRALRPPLFVLAAARVVAETVGRLREEGGIGTGGNELAAWLETERSGALWREAVDRFGELRL